jgi:hypothetical protein
LLGIAQSCRFQDKSFLKFLLSEEKDVDLFKAPEIIKHTKAIEKAIEIGPAHKAD